MKSFILLTLIILLGIASSASGQYHFGKNKIQYAQFDWQLMKTEHFDVYFYPEEKVVAEKVFNYIKMGLGGDDNAER